MKAPAFQFYPGDFLSSPDVQIMEAHEVGAYLLLLCAAWQSERPGYLPNDEGRLRRLARLSAEQWKESSTLVLGKFPVQEGGETRANKRMLTELEKQESFRQSRAEAGRASAAKRTQAQQDANKNSTRVELKATRVEETANKNPTLLSSSSSSIERSTNADSATPSSAGLALKAEKEKEKELDFISFWLGYHGNLPKRSSKSKAKAKWQTLSAATRALIIAGLEAHRADSTRNGPDYLPYATKFLNEQRWESETYGTAPALPTLLTPTNELPLPRMERPGQIINVAGYAHDESMNRMKLATYQGYWPKAQINMVIPR